MHQGNWTCSTCGGAITELPFEPRGTTGLTCRTCYAKQKDTSSQEQPPEMSGASEEMPNDMPHDAGLAGEPAPGESIGTPVAAGGDRPKFSGTWTCAGCGAPITSLPFEPRDTSNLKCIDCFKKSKA
jgi:CxxC-x17-CxxC domain-containing protein